ncbi:hypothetical protein L1987_85921 [Smallanthus sonchifolius]|uniref:Uncharacterized protein n=1 Tax=Smallanthus sonchifolius TaxID=185202 RepID=A0ACB8XZ50_9ASTR|nr:hypothetical protein L1987_85921 [Smallanthus sonchifolius]
MGSKFSDDRLQHDIESWPFKIIEGSVDKPIIVLEHKGEEKEFTPEEISSVILKNLKEAAEAYLGTTVTDVVITVLTYFSDKQRQATKDAGTLAGLNVLRLINEPTAAAIAYRLDKLADRNHPQQNTVFIFDLEFKKRQKKDMSGNAKAMERLKVACEKAKRDLSSTTQTSIEIDSLELFDWKPLCKSINSDEAVAYGAAVLAANLSGNGNKTVKDLILLDVTPLSLGIEVNEGDMNVIIPKNTPIPTTREMGGYATRMDKQVAIAVSVYQGECSKVKENIFLDQFPMYGVPPGPAGKEKMKVRFSIDANGILNVSAKLESTVIRKV